MWEHMKTFICPRISQERMFPTSNECNLLSFQHIRNKICMRQGSFEDWSWSREEGLGIFTPEIFWKANRNARYLIAFKHFKQTFINLPFIYSPWFYHNGNIQRQPRSSVTIKYFLVTMKIIDPQQHNTAIIGTAAT